MTITRQLWVVAHRWAGLTIALFLVIAGLTGSLLAFYDELSHATAPRFHLSAAPSPEAQRIDPLVLRAQVEERTGAYVNSVRLDAKPGEALHFYPDPRPGEAPLGYDEIAVNPYTGEEQGRRMGGDLGEGWHNIMPFIYELHYSLALGDWGQWAFGIAALIWTIDCFVGFYLTLPVARGGWWRRWRKAWTIRRPVRAGPKLNFDLHLAGGLWLWPILFVFAWSSVGFNLPKVFEPVMDSVFGAAPPAPPKLATQLVEPRIDWPEALALGRQHATELAARDGFEVYGDFLINLNRGNGTWRYRFASSRDINDEPGQSQVVFDANDGRLLSYRLPSGQSSRLTVERWLYALHMGKVFGMPYRIFVCVLGLVVTMLVVTGVLMWTRKRSARILQRPARQRTGTLQPAE
jgi:uncharacterized iron-regulated membrane protein